MQTFMRVRAATAAVAAVILAACAPRSGPAPCASGSVTEYANTSCTLGAAVLAFGDATAIYNPAADCKVSGSGPVCPGQNELQFRSDLGPGTLLLAANPNRFALSCGSNCSMSVAVHYTVTGATQAGPRLNAAGGSGAFEVIGLQWINGATGKAECNGSGCGNGADVSCATAPPYCTVLGSSANYSGSGAQPTTATWGVSCGSGGCKTQVNTLGLHHH